MGLIVDADEMLQSSCMVAMPMRDEDIINSTKVYAHSLCIADEHVAGSRVEQDAMVRCL